jgi:hypothetical protein
MKGYRNMKSAGKSERKFLLKNFGVLDLMGETEALPKVSVGLRSADSRHGVPHR